ncbi:uncharacterized protein Z520_09867 [Fonsecaea multimorphosa CBS 102226]|uniref:Methyltransferase type 11 domain-containing protein n=1 Tax=Fonsecaea multimorphosa CBS 102226 TaxID=1442371 RepID=A0A0D2IBG1_9EURO|nr:uncharacterized protein Z520_09867 [Fonsecaea multimorphosa CBS 102226]KIX94481.1 hypothetical protein Z520_09867 [Fonsecaea multimorphosa CBS 102226]OAL20060.1 hypothetical protein AYO22_09210 [Fonsecaea multimorphosa]
MGSSNPLQRLVSYALPGAFMLTSVVCHVQTAIFHPGLLFSQFARYKEKAFASLWAIGGLICARDTPASLGPILAQSRGVILDVGPGAGHQLFRFSNPQDIEAIYGAEPGVSMHAALGKRAEEAGLGDKYHVLGCEAQLESLVPALAKAGVLKPSDTHGGSGNTPFDEIVCIRVLCGIPDVDKVTEGLYSLLKPGGRMVVCEHVVNSGDATKGGTAVGRSLQKFYMWIGWSSIMGGCELTRDTLASLHRAAQRDGGWDKVEVELCDPYSTIPHIVGTLVKRR